MDVFIWPIIFFIIAFLLHAAVWRLRHPKNPVRALIVLFSTAALAGVVFLINFTNASLSHLIYFLALFFSFFICYLATYPAIEADSPSMVIVSRVSRSGPEGLSREKIEEFLGDELLVDPRLKDLVDASLADMAGAVYKINKKGELFILPFVAYRNFLGMGKGG